MPQRRSTPVETLGDYFSALAGDTWRKSSFLYWPPDVFCLMASLLNRTGAYIRLAQKWPPTPPPGGEDLAPASDPSYGGKRWAMEMARRGKLWWEFAFYQQKPSVLLKKSSKPSTLCPEIAKAWKAIERLSETSISELIDHRSDTEHEKFWAAVFECVAAADEACAGIGVADRSKFLTGDDEEIDWFLFHASARIASANTLCLKIPAYLGSVLPKMHTPQYGLTLRSITHNLAYIRPTEVSISFAPSFSRAGFFSEKAGDETLSPGHSLNILFVPWPSEVKPSDFEALDCPAQSIADGFRFFSYAPKRPSIDSRKKWISSMIDDAKEVVGKIDGVLFPELALGQHEDAKTSEADEIASTVWEKTPHAFFIAGVGASTSPNKKFGANKAVFAASRFNSFFQQEKHHRWQLDGAQIDQYGLGSKLDPGKKWWEHIPIQTRKINFFSVSERVTLTLLICEDLARQDPVADVIRSVGPNLVVALLMDGPQLSARWPAHYATVLADDPGSSVLTVTSIGMSRLCRPKGTGVSRVVGLWKDRIQGFREIELPVDATALVLTLTLIDKPEWTADGRGDNGQSTYLTLNGIHPIFTKANT